MKITRHIHYQENPTSCVRIEILFNPPYELKSTLGKVDAAYPDADFSKPCNSNRLEQVNPVINQNGLRHIRELMNVGEVLSIELRTKHRLSDIVVDSAHEFELQAARNSLQYVFYIGKSGMVVITGKLVKDDDGFYGKLNADLNDLAVRDYIKQRSIVTGRKDIEWSDLFPDVMNVHQAAAFLGISPSTVYKKAQSGDIPRNRNKKFLKAQLDRYRNPADYRKRSR